MLSYLYSHMNAPKSLMERVTSMTTPAPAADKAKSGKDESGTSDLPPGDSGVPADAATPPAGADQPVKKADAATPPTDMPPTPQEQPEKQPATKDKGSSESSGNPAPKN
jgi:hypothetical protein